MKNEQKILGSLVFDIRLLAEVSYDLRHPRMTKDLMKISARIENNIATDLDKRIAYIELERLTHYLNTTPKQYQEHDDYIYLSDVLARTIEHNIEAILPQE